MPAVNIQSAVFDASYPYNVYKAPLLILSYSYMVLEVLPRFLLVYSAVVFESRGGRSRLPRLIVSHVCFPADFLVCVDRSLFEH